MQCLKLPEKSRDELLVNSNLVMQMFDEKGVSPYKTFESISRFAHLLSACCGDNFAPRITRQRVTDNTEIILIEPACGSNTMIIQSTGDVIFVDSGYALYQEEMVKIFREHLPNFDEMKKRILVTHADVDHCGLLPLFDEIITSVNTKRCLELEFLGKDGYREQNPLHKPYVNMCKLMTGYQPVDPEKINAVWEVVEARVEPSVKSLVEPLQCRGV